MSKRRKMQSGDWFNTAINVVFGFLLGSPIHDLVQLATADFWLVVLIAPALFTVFFLSMLALDKLFDWVFPSGIRPARNPQRKGGTPLARLLSLPAAVTLGFIWASF